MAIRLMFVEVETQRSLEDFSIYSKQYQSSGNIVEGNWDNLCSAGVSVMVVRDTAFKTFKTYTEETVREGVSQLRAADLVIGYNLRDFAYPVLSEYTTYDLQRLPTFDIQAEIQFLRAKRANVHWIKQKDQIPFISLSNVAKYTCDRQIYSSGREMPRLWNEGKQERVIEHVRERVEATQAIFNHGCKHGAVSYKQAGNPLPDPVVLPTPLWKHKARSMVESVVPRIHFCEDEEHAFSLPPERMFALPNPNPKGI